LKIVVFWDVLMSFEWEALSPKTDNLYFGQSRPTRKNKHTRVLVTTCLLIITVQQSAFLLRMQALQGSNLGLGTGYSD